MDWASLWYSALNAEVGIAVTCLSDPGVTKQKLYRERARLGDEALSVLSIVSSPHHPQELWIIKRKTSDENS